MPKRMSQKAFYEIAIKLIRKHGSVVIYFKSDAGYMRRRKIRSDGKCFVSHMGFYSGTWDRYGLSCFVLDLGKITVTRCFKEMIKHDKDYHLTPITLEWGKGKNMKRIEYEARY